MNERKHLCALLLVLAFTLNGLAATTNVFVVTSTDDSGAGSLRETIQQANSLGGGTISLSVTGTITLTSSLPPLMNIELLGPGTNVLNVSGSRLYRPFEIPVGSTSIVAGLAVSLGSSSNGGAILNSGHLVIRDAFIHDNKVSAFPCCGGAIFNDGSLTVLDSTIASNSADGGIEAEMTARGGGIFNAGDLILHRSQFRRNSAAGTSHLIEGPSEDDGLPAWGGAISSSNGTVAISQCSFEGNRAIGGHGLSSGVGPLFDGPGYAASGHGGALAIEAGSLFVTNSYFLSNSVSAGGGGVRNGSAEGGAIAVHEAFLRLWKCRLTGNFANGGQGGYAGRSGPPGGSGSGGAVFIENGTSEILHSLISSNRVTGGIGAGAYGPRGGAARGGPAMGGGIAARSATLTMSGSTVAFNTAVAGRGGGSSADSYASGGSGGRATGGGIAISNTVNFALMNSTISGNAATGGIGGVWSQAFGMEIHSSGGSAEGGGLWLHHAPALLEGCSVISNAAYGGAFMISNILTRASSRGGGLWNENSFCDTLSLLFQGNAATNGSDAAGIRSQGFNLFSNSSGLSNLLSTDITDVDAMVGPLQDNGGPTWTHALLAGSPAIDRGDAGTNRLDQRGLPRGIDYPGIPNASNGDDIGAFESDPMLKFTGIESSGTEIHVRFATRSDATYVLQSARDVSGPWENSTSIPGTGGVVRYSAGPALQEQRFFRVAEGP